MISRISNINFTPTEISAENLSKERVSGSVYVVGNTVLDNLTKCGYGVYGNKIIVTIHRRENHDIIHEWFSEINKLAIQYPYYEFILPIHPNPNVRKHINLLTDVNVVEPMHHDKLIQILKDCRLIITDSGGLQEEGSFFNKKVIVCRKTTERPEGIATGHLHMCQSPAQLHQLFYDIEKYPFINEKCPYGDGNSSEIVKKIINEEFQRTFF
jgi:UDP-N-acetylglucosamine 2-epimerase